MMLKVLPSHHSFTPFKYSHNSSVFHRQHVLYVVTSKTNQNFNRFNEFKHKTDQNFGGVLFIST